MNPGIRRAELIEEAWDQGSGTGASETLCRSHTAGSPFELESRLLSLDKGNGAMSEHYCVEKEVAEPQAER